MFGPILTSKPQLQPLAVVPCERLTRHLVVAQILSVSVVSDPRTWCGWVLVVSTLGDVNLRLISPCFINSKVPCLLIVFCSYSLSYCPAANMPPERRKYNGKNKCQRKIMEDHERSTRNRTDFDILWHAQIQLPGVMTPGVSPNLLAEGAFYPSRESPCCQSNKYNHIARGHLFFFVINLTLHQFHHSNQKSLAFSTVWGHGPKFSGNYSQQLWPGPKDTTSSKVQVQWFQLDLCIRHHMATIHFKCLVRSGIRRYLHMFWPMPIQSTLSWNT